MFKKVVIGLAAFALVACLGIALVGGLGVYAFAHRDDGVLNPARRVFAASISQDLAQHPSNYQDDFTPDAYATLQNEIGHLSPAIGAVVQCAYPGTVRYETGTTATAQVEMVARLPNGKQLLDIASYHLVRQNGQWRLSDLGHQDALSDVSGSPQIAHCQGAALYFHPASTPASRGNAGVAVGK